MKKIIILFLMFFPFFVSAYTEEDIINLVSNKKMCDSETNVMYEQYLNTYSLIIKNKQMSENDLNNIYKMLEKNLKYLEENNICSIDELNKIPSKEKSRIKKELYDGLKTIAKSPNKENSDTTIKYNSDSSIEIYNNGTLVEKIDNNFNKFNYVGVSPTIVYLKYALAFSLIIIIALLFILKGTILKNILNILLPINLFLCIISFALGKYIFGAYNIIKTMNVKENKEIVDIKVNGQKILNNPSYGANYANLKIDALKIDLPIYYGDSKKILKQGIGHTTSSKLPGEGARIIYSGHNSKDLLNNLKKIKVDDLITVETSYGIFEYQVVEFEVLNENEMSKLKKNNKETLILYTCYPFDEIIYSKERFIVYASLIEMKWFDE